MRGTRPLSPQEITASLWSDLQELKDAISMSDRARPWQKAKKLLDGLEGDLPDEKLVVKQQRCCHASEYSTALYPSLAYSRDTVRCICQYGRKGRG